MRLAEASTQAWRKTDTGSPLSHRMKHQIKCICLGAKGSRRDKLQRPLINTLYRGVAELTLTTSSTVGSTPSA